MRFRVSILIFMFLMMLSGCGGDNHDQLTSDQALEREYQDAIIDAMVAENSEICDNLIDISETNSFLYWQGDGSEKRVLVVTWTDFDESFPEGHSITTWWGETWVTAVPEMKDWFATNYRTDTDLTLRAEQLLGLPKDAGYTHFVELWVKPQDLFRPAPDHEITDKVAQLEFPESADQQHIDWFNSNIIYSYFPARYPWTRLGYTYDWGTDQAEIGLSEFVLKKDSEVVVEAVTTTALYLDPQ